MSDTDNERDIAVLKNDVEHITATLREMQDAAARRELKQSNNTRMVLDKLDALTHATAGYQGFISGAQFTVKTFWVTIGAIGSGVIAWLATGNNPFK